MNINSIHIINKYLRKFAFFASFAFFIFSCTGKQTPYQENTGEIFHTYYSIKYEFDHSLESEILAELQRFDLSLNPFNPQSIISKVNKNEAVEADSFFVEVFRKAMEVSEASGGMFDITVAPFVNLWGFGYENTNIVNPAVIDSLKEFVGYRKIRLEGNRIVKTDSRVQLNTSAISKGYAVDVVCQLFERQGIKNYMCEIGGELRSKGVNEKGKCWRIGISKPIDDKTGLNTEIQAILKICDKAVATSGNYRNFYIRNGKKYAHTINPLTGYPSEQDILSATVIANDCMTADAYATAFMALGSKEAQKLKIPNVDYYFILANDEIVYSTGFENFFSTHSD